MRKVILSLLLLSLVLILIIGCSKGKELNQPVEESVITEKIKVNVIVNKNISADAIENLKKRGLTVSFETEDHLVLTGEVNKTEFEELQQNQNIENVVKKRESQQLTDKDMQDIIDQARARENITVGPYIRPELLEELKDKKYAPAYIRFRIEYRVNNKICFDEVTSRLSIVDFKSEESERGALKGEITKEGVDKLRNVECILDIGWRDLSIPRSRE